MQTMELKIQRNRNLDKIKLNVSKNKAVNKNESYK